jgi:hypothetical protein
VSNGQQSTHTEVESVWRHYWEAAKLRLELARIRVREVEIEVTLNPRAICEYQTAAAAERAAQLEYSRVLRIYMDLVVHGRAPELAGQLVNTGKREAAEDISTPRVLD